VCADLAARVDTQLQQLQQVISTEVAALNAVIQEHQLPVVG
jgi:hypothetical protein